MNSFEVAQLRMREDLESDEVIGTEEFQADIPDNVFPIRPGIQEEIEEPEEAASEDEESEASEEPNETSVTTDTLELYFMRLRKVKLLTREEEVKLSKRKESGDESAFDRMVEANQGLVIKAAGKYRNQGLDMLDLISEGNIGLMKAISRFDWRRGNKISTYATPLIAQQIKAAIEDSGHIVRRGSYVQRRMSKIHRVRSNLTQELGRSPKFEEIAEITGLDTEVIRELCIREVLGNAISLETPIGPDRDSELMELVSDKKQNTFAQAAENLQNEALYAAVDTLPPEQKRAIELKYGLYGNEPMSMREVAGIMGIEESKARRHVVNGEKAMRPILEGRRHAKQTA